LLDGGVKGVHVDMDDFTLGLHGIYSDDRPFS
jgi:hypothetical protein